MWLWLWFFLRPKTDLRLHSTLPPCLFTIIDHNRMLITPRARRYLCSSSLCMIYSSTSKRSKLWNDQIAADCRIKIFREWWVVKDSGWTVLDFTLSQRGVTHRGRYITFEVLISLLLARIGLESTSDLLIHSLGDLSVLLYVREHNQQQWEGTN